jgi:outer membrane receptor for ferrienterochelin and colicin
MGITEDSHNHALATGVYAQDEWKINKQLTLNYGLRFDSYNATFDNESQLSPRVNLVDKLDDATTAHVGFARYFVPPPTQDITPEQVAKFDGTTNAASVTSADPPKVERSSYMDAGISHQINQAWSVNVDAYYKQARQLIDLGQFGQAVILSPYNYKSGYDYGAEMSSSYTMDGFSVFGNFSYCLTRGRDIDSQEFQIASDELAYIKTHYIPLDHQGEYTFSGGISDKLTPHDLIFANVLYGSGLRGGFANDEKEPQYAPVSLGYQHIFQVDPSGKDLIKLRFDVVNLFDEVYRLRSGSGIGVEAPQFGQRRGYFVGLDYDF